MGHVYSKKKRDRRLKKELSDDFISNIAKHDPETFHRVAQMKINRLSADLERLSLGSSYFSRESIIIPDPKGKTMSLNRNLNGNCVSKPNSLVLNESFSYEKLNVDDHPALTKLQNEHNRRKELMEEKMCKIKMRAMQEAERQKYARMFRARTDKPDTPEPLNKANDDLLKDIQLKPISSSLQTSNCIDQDDKGEIIPVRVVNNPVASNTEQKDKTKLEKPNNYLQDMLALNNVDLNDPKSYLSLPFLFVVFIITLMIRTLQCSEVLQRTDNSRHKKRN